ncbi:MAG: hypothetical protein V7K53_03885 [Nostoc sp.]|uniref:hypothetical protein n=1 Tax=Nostoc sp. TaxID=1180 RepID=UPI002FF77390
MNIKTIEIKNLQAPEIEELDDSELMGVVGGGLLDGGGEKPIPVLEPFPFVSKLPNPTKFKWWPSIFDNTDGD